MAGAEAGERSLLNCGSLGVRHFHSSHYVNVFLFATLLMTGWGTPTPAQRAPGAVSIVAQLYRDFAWEAVVEEPHWHGHELVDQPRAVLLRYFDERLTNLLLADRACNARTHGICKLDFLFMWDSQDPAATELKVLPTSDSGVVRVTFRYPNGGKSVYLKYKLVRTASGWRIDDIVNGSQWALRALLTGKN